MAELSFNDLLTRFNTKLRDSTNLTFSAAEKTDVLTSAINDPYVAKPTVDTSLTTAANTYSYTLPDGLSEIFDLGLDMDSDGIFHHVARDNYELIDGNIYFTNKALPTGKTIQLRARQKLTTNDTFPDKVQDYILELAQAGAFELLKTSKTSRFVKNDITMVELLASINSHKAEAARLRQDLINQRLVTL